MKWLLITDNDTLENEVSEALAKKNSDNAVVKCSINKKSIKEKLDELVSFYGCLLYSEEKVTSKNMLLLSNLTGILISKEIPVITNIASLLENSLIQSDLFHVVENKEGFLSDIASNYEKVYEVSTKRISKNNLLNKGIPFTSDCFGSYIAKNKPVIIEEFLSAGMGVNVRDDTGTPMLNVACRNDNYEIVEQLLDLGADINASSDDRGYTAVMDAIWRGNEKITKFLISKGADLNTVNKEGQTNLILAVGADRINLVKLLAENGADPDVKDMMGMSAYNYATLFRKEKIVEILKPYHKEI